MNLLCLLGIHINQDNKTEWIPSINAKIVTEYKHKISCKDCGKELFNSHLKWNGKEMTEQKP